MQPSASRIADLYLRKQAHTNTLIWYVLDERGFYKVYRDLEKTDPQAAALAREVVQKLSEEMAMSGTVEMALGRMRGVIANPGWDPSLQRNNIFKAADLLGIRLPSSMFASDRSRTAGRGKRTSVKAQMKLKDGTVYPRGTAAEVVFSERQPWISEVIIEGRTFKVPTRRLHRYFKGFSKEPSVRTLEKWQDDGLGSTVTGKRRVELDGYGPDGSPSWYLALGLI